MIIKIIFDSPSFYAVPPVRIKLWQKIDFIASFGMRKVNWIHNAVGFATLMHEWDIICVGFVYLKMCLEVKAVPNII